jgi:beta-mannosidase
MNGGRSAVLYRNLEEIMLTSFQNDSHDRVLLHEHWVLHLPEGIEELGDSAGKTIAAKLPGCVHLDLMNAGLIDDPFHSDMEKKLRWVDETEWTYSCRFFSTEEYQAEERKRRQLVFEGLDTFAKVYLDGKLLGVTENMFHPHRFNLPPNFAPGEHELQVCFDSPLKHVNRIVEERGPAPDSLGWHRGWARKAGYSYGWDWGPELPGAGMIRPVYLQSWVGGRISWFQPIFSGDEHSGVLTVHVEYEVEDTGDWILECQLQHGKETYATFQEYSVEQGSHGIDLQLAIDNPVLWWPSGSGDPVLHPLTLCLIRNGKTVHQISERIGLRTVEWIETPDEWGQSFHVRVNGHDLFAKGANWIPSDNFLPRVTPDIYHRLLDQAVAANMNMLRVWGGGVYEDPEFYRSADERGLMIWQDFMYACSLYPDDPEFRKNALEEAKWVIASLVRYPSIVIWCGNNEIERDAVEFQERFGTTYLGKTLWYEQLPELLNQMAPGVHYVASSPLGGDTANDPSVGDRHVWSIWSGWQEAKDYRFEEGRFISEFGFQAPANVATWKDYLDKKDLDRDSEVFKLHNKQVDGPGRIEHFLKLNHIDPGTFAAFVRASQDVQARSLAVGIEFWRSRRPRTMGTLIWQLNDCWPVTSWALLDSKMRPKASWYRVARAYSARTVVLLPEEGVAKVFLLNDTGEPWTAETRITIHDLSRGQVSEKQSVDRVDGASVACVDELPLEEWVEDSPSKILVAEIVGDVVSARTILFPRHFRDMESPGSKVTVQVAGKSEVLLRSEGYSFGVWVEDEDNPDLMFSDNALDMLPGEVVRLTATSCRTGNPVSVKKPVVHRIPFDR